MDNSSFVNDTIDNPIHTNRYQSDPQACSESHDLLLCIAVHLHDLPCLHRLVRLMCLLDLLIMHVRQAHTPKNRHHTFLLHCRQLALALHEQHPGEPERVDAQRVSRFREHMLLRAPRDKEHVLERQDHIVRRTPDRLRRVVPHSGERQVEQRHEGLPERILEFLA